MPEFAFNYCYYIMITQVYFCDTVKGIIIII